jgi:signal transduction histidine kinase
MSFRFYFRLFKALLTACLLGLAAAPAALAADLVTAGAFWEDASGQATLAQAQAEPMTAFSGVLSRGFTRSATWIRLTVTPPAGASADDKLVLRIRPIYLDEITLHDPLYASAPRTTGDRYNPGESEYASLAHTFLIPAGDKPRDLWLRLHTTSTSLIDPEVFTLADMRKSEFRLQLAYGLVLCLTSVFLVLVFIQWVHDRDRLYAAFVIRHLIYCVYTASFFGFHRYLLDGVVDAKYLDVAYNWLVVGTTGFSVWFESRFLGEYQPPAWARWTIRGLLAWSCLAAALLLAGEIFLALKANMLLNGVGIIVLLLVAALFIDDRRAQERQLSSLMKKRVVVTYYACIAALLVFSVLPYVGAVAGNEFSVNGLVFYALCSGVIVTVIMQMRANQLRRSNAQFERELLLSSQRVALEKAKREEQSQLLTMLMHELKTPLTVIDLAQQSSTDLQAQGYVARNVAIIKNILDRCLNADRIAVGKLTTQMQSVRIADLLTALHEQHASGADRLAVEPGGEHLQVTTDYACLQIILNNLVDNALRYGDPADPVQVRVAARRQASGQAGVVISVANKTGLASWPDPERLFQKYYRSPGAQSVSGTGLGLFLVASLASLIGATCTYAPDDTYVRFELWLPS